jgi:hypothetical protein
MRQAVRISIAAAQSIALIDSILDHRNSYLSERGKGTIEP